MKIGIVTDSTCDIPQDMREEFNINVIPAVMVIDGKDVPKQILQKAVSHEQIEGLAEFMEKISRTSRKLLSE